MAGSATWLRAPRRRPQGHAGAACPALSPGVGGDPSCLSRSSPYGGTSAPCDALRRRGVQGRLPVTLPAAPAFLTVSDFSCLCAMCSLICSLRG